MDQLLSLHRAARHVGVTSKWLRAEADAERIPYLRAGSRYLFDVETLTRSLKQRIVSQLIETSNGKVLLASDLASNEANSRDAVQTGDRSNG